MIITNKKYPDNYTLAGVTAFMYNIDVKDFFDPSNNFNVYSQYSNLTDVGFEWKKSSDSTWTKVSVINDKTHQGGKIRTIDEINNGSSYDSDMGDRYKCIRYSPFEPKTYPVRVMVMNLQASTGYNVRSYYTLGETKTTYNEKSVTTMGGRSTINFSTPQISDEARANVDADELQAYVDKVTQACNLTKEIFTMFYSGLSVTITVKIEYDSGYWAAKAGQNQNRIDFNANYRSESLDSTRSVVIHELGHNFMKIDYNRPSATYKDKMIKFMEFATDCPYATWRWLSKHCYPIISSARYNYIDDCLVTYAYCLSQQMTQQ